MQGFLFPSDGWKISIRWSQHDGLAVNHTASWWWICAFFNIYTPSKILAKNKKEYRFNGNQRRNLKYEKLENTLNYVKTIKNIKALAVCWLSGWYCFTKKVLCVLIPILSVRNVRVGTGFPPTPQTSHSSYDWMSLCCVCDRHSVTPRCFPTFCSKLWLWEGSGSSMTLNRNKLVLHMSITGVLNADLSLFIRNSR